MRPAILALLTFALLLAAGCSTPKSDAGADDGSPSAAAPERDDGSPPATPGPGTPADPGQAAPPVAASSLGPVVLTIDEDGDLPPAVGALGNMPTAIVTGRGNSWLHQDIPGTVLEANLTLTWTPAAASSTSLSMTFTPVQVNSDGSEQYTGTQKTVAGDGPLHLVAKNLKWDDETYTISIWWSGTAAYTPTGQSFHVAGTITYQP